MNGMGYYGGVKKGNDLFNDIWGYLFELIQSEVNTARKTIHTRTTTMQMGYTIIYGSKPNAMNL